MKTHLETTVNGQDMKSNPLKALDILEALAEHSSSMGIADLSDRTGLSKSTVHRILTALVERQYVIRNETTKRYRSGFKLLSLSATLLDKSEIKRIARQGLIQLSEATGETVHLVCLDLYEGVYIDKIDTPKSVGLLSTVGKRIPLYCTGAGKVVLAWQSEQWLEGYLENVELKGFTPRTITTKEKLLKEVEQIRVQGFSLDDEEHHENINCIAAPIMRSDGVLAAAISISAPAYRFSIKDALSFKDILIEKAEQISSRL